MVKSVGTRGVWTITQSARKARLHVRIQHSIELLVGATAAAALVADGGESSRCWIPP